MISWSSKRQLSVIAIIGALILIFVVILIFSNQEPPSCFDGKLNQNEGGVDCGGLCDAVCQSSAEDVAILWSRVVPVAQDVYSVVAMIENPNLDFEAKHVPYTFKLYDDRNILIYERKGEGFFPSGSTFPIFEHALRTGFRTPARATFELRGAPFWEQAGEEDSGIRIVSKNLVSETETPKLTVVVKNTTFENVFNITFVALLFDENDNLVNASQTVLDRLEGEETDTIAFTWPQPFGSVITKINVISSSYTR